MSEVKLNLIDSLQTLHGTIHGSVADACVAALSAEPETIAELASALARYNKPLDDHSPFATFHSRPHSSVYSSPESSREPSLDAEPWDAGIVLIDLSARIVAIESTYSMPQPSGEVRYHDGTKATDIPVLYRLPDDWLFVNSVEAYLWSRERRAEKRLRKTPLDARKILYGAPLLDFIVSECGKIEISVAATAGDDTGPAESGESEDPLWREISSIHSRWLTTPREDLDGSSPRDLMLSKQDFIDFDLHTRALQWSLQDEGPPCLGADSHAYRFAGFGTHEWVIYYDLVRHLLWSALDSVRQTSVCLDLEVADKAQSAGHSEDLTGSGTTNTEPGAVATGSFGQLPGGIDSEIARLEALKSRWLEQPQPDYDGRIPAILSENERRRLPIALRPRDMIIDEDCPMCQMFGDETSPLGMGVGFWHLDGCNMDDGFAFSSCRTREEWEAENRRRDEFSKEFDRKWEARRQRIARGEILETDPLFDPVPFDLNPFPDLKRNDSNLFSGESADDEEKEFSQ